MIFRLVGSPVDHQHDAADRLDQGGVVGGVGVALVGPPQHVGPEGLRRLHRHQVVAVERVRPRSPSVDPLDGVGDRHAGDGGVGAGQHGLDHRLEQRRARPAVGRRRAPRRCRSRRARRPARRRTESERSRAAGHHHVGAAARASST